MRLAYYLLRHPHFHLYYCFCKNLILYLYGFLWAIWVIFSSHTPLKFYINKYDLLMWYNQQIILKLNIFLMEFTTLFNFIASGDLFNTEAFKYCNFGSSPQKTPWQQEVVLRGFLNYVKATGPLISFGSKPNS